MNYVDISILKLKKLEKNSYLLSGNDSIYYRNYYGYEVIFIRNDLYGYDEEFKLRHELGHAILHTSIPSSKYINIGKLERQANYFALALKGIRFDLISTEIEGMTLEQIASYVEVPYDTLFQLSNL